jgi:hypothetical protein
MDTEAPVRITGIIWLRNIVDKLEQKHQVSPVEVEEIFIGQPRLRRIEPGDVDGEDLYAALGRTAAGRYLIVFFIQKAGDQALVISARDMSPRERRAYGKK